MIQIFSPGSESNIGDLKVTILAALIRGSLVQYEVAWICNGTRTTAWVEEHELSGSKSLEVGFKLGD